MIRSSESTNYKTLLEKDGVFVQFIHGTSMMPMLKRGQDTVIIERLTAKPKANDVVLYQNNQGKYVLHRVVKVKKDGYVIRGDNCLHNEYDITDEHIFGILTGFYKKEKYIDCKKDRTYKCYVFFNRNTYFIRAMYMYTHYALSKIKRCIFKQKI